MQGPARWWLQRQINTNGRGTVAFVMLNPSTADDNNDDPTIRRCKGFALSWGYAQLVVVNTNPMRSTDPKRTPIPTALDAQVNDQYLLRAARDAGKIVCAWGNNVDSGLRKRTLDVLGSTGRFLYHLGLTKRGEPRHPLYLPSELKPTPWEQPKC